MPDKQGAPGTADTAADTAADAAGAAVLEVSKLRKEFGSLTAVADVSFRIPVGKSLAIVGESGSGKTTIARMIVGLERATERHH